MATRTLNGDPEQVVVGTEGMVFESLQDSLTKGAILDLTGFTGTEIKEGHLILKDANGNFKPMPLNTAKDAYATSIPTGYSAYGLCPVTTRLDEAMCPVGLRGRVNEALLPYTLTTDMKTALKHIIFV